jgi:hypothetical protein
MKLSVLLIRMSGNDGFRLVERSRYLGSCVIGLGGTAEKPDSRLSLPYVAFKEAT